MDKKLKYLIVEDDAVSVRIIKLELTGQGFHVEYDHIENEEQMRQKLGSTKYDLIISDHHMPSFNSIDALRVRNEIVPLVPFIVLSINISEHDQREAFLNGCTAVIKKDGVSLLGDLIGKLVNADEV